MSNPTVQPCPSCGAAASGKFCSACGTALGARVCAHCEAELSTQARFCHRCGQPVGRAAGGVGAQPNSERKAWLVAGALCVVLVVGIAYQVSSAAPAAAPDMANAGVSSGAPPNQNPA